MTTLFSVNLNKIALIRNSRGTNYPNLIYFVDKLSTLGVKGFTVHPRPDERHIKYSDVYDIKDYLSDHTDIEFNIEGNPNNKFLQLIKAVKPHQCTLVPDSVAQLTSDHGYDIIKHHDYLSHLSGDMQEFGTRCAVFVDPDVRQIKAAINSDIGAIEIYTEAWAKHYANRSHNNSSSNYNVSQVQQWYKDCINLANDHHLRVNAGHDLNLHNLDDLLKLGDIAEVSIGHAFTVESLELGMDRVVAQYLQICAR